MKIDGSGAASFRKRAPLLHFVGFTDSYMATGTAQRQGKQFTVAENLLCHQGMALFSPVPCRDLYDGVNWHARTHAPPEWLRQLSLLAVIKGGGSRKRPMDSAIRQRWLPEGNNNGNHRH